MGNKTEAGPVPWGTEPVCSWLGGFLRKGGGMEGNGKFCGGSLLCALLTKNYAIVNRICSIYLVDKCPCMRYNSTKFKGRYKAMTTRFSSTTSCSNRCFAVGASCASNSICRLLDTAELLVVSIFALCLLILRVILPIG